MDNPIRLILKKVQTDSNGQQIEAGYKTFDIDNKDLESLLFEVSPHFRGKFEIVGAELLNESELRAAYDKEGDLDF